MRPTGTEIARRRWTVRIVLRLGGVGLLALSVFPIVSWISEGLADNDLFSYAGYVSRVLMAVLSALTGAAVLWLADRLAGWATRPAAPACPGCGYDTGDHDRCPECGLDLTSDPARAPAPWTRDRVAWLVSILSRAVGLFLVLTFLFESPGLVWYLAYYVPQVADAGWYWSWVWSQGAQGAVGLTLFVLAPVLARLVVGRGPAGGAS